MLRAASTSGSSDADDRAEASVPSASNGAPVAGIQAPVKLYPSSHRVSMTKYATSTDSRGFIPVYEYPLNGQTIMIDTETGMVLFTSIWKSLGHTKADVVRLIESQPDIAGLVRKVRGGYLKIQGTWLPFEIAESLARRVAWTIRDDLVPLFGPTFPASCLAPGDAGFGQLVLSSPKTKAKRQAKNPEARAAAQAAAQAAQNNSTVTTANQAAASKPIMSKLAHERPARRADAVGPARKSNYGKSPGYYGASLQRSASAGLAYQPYQMPGVVSSTRYSPYGTYYSTPSHSYPPPPRNYAAPRTTSYSFPPPPTTAAYTYIPATSSTQAAAGLLHLTSQQQGQHPYRFPDPSTYKKATEPFESPSSDASSLDFGDSPARATSRDAPAISRTLTFGDEHRPPAAAWTDQDYPQSEYQPTGASYASHPRGYFEGTPITTCRPSFSLPSNSSYSESSLRNTSDANSQPHSAPQIDYRPHLSSIDHSRPAPTTVSPFPDSATRRSFYHLETPEVPGENFTNGSERTSTPKEGSYEEDADAGAKAEEAAMWADHDARLNVRL